MNKYISTDELAVIALGIALVLAILFNIPELATSIASGLTGYLGRALLDHRKDLDNVNR